MSSKTLDKIFNDPKTGFVGEEKLFRRAHSKKNNTNKSHSSNSLLFLQFLSNWSLKSGPDAKHPETIMIYNKLWLRLPFVFLNKVLLSAAFPSLPCQSPVVDTLSLRF